MPKLGSISSIAKSGGVHSFTLRDVLIARWVIPSKAKDQPCSATLVDFQIGYEVALEMRRAVAVIALPGLLNASRPMATCLINTGLLAALHGGNGQKQGKVSRSIDGLRVEAIINEINRSFPKVDTAPEGFVKLAKAAEMSRVPMEVILIGVFRYHLERVFRLQSEPGLGGLLVDPQEVKALPARFRTRTCPSCCEPVPADSAFGSDIMYAQMIPPHPPPSTFERLQSSDFMHAAFGRHFLT